MPTQITLKKPNSNRMKVLIILGILLLSIISGIYLVQNCGQYAETDQSSAEGGCPPGGVPIPGGCHYAKPGVSYDGVSGVNPNHASIEDRDPACNPVDSFQVDVSQYNVCNFTHTQACVQGGWDNTESGCVNSADWECCSPLWFEGQIPERRIALPDGSFPTEKEYYSSDSVQIEGRLEVAECGSIEGWAGTVSDFDAQVDIFFTIGKPYSEGGVVFNPGVTANVGREDGAVICDFLDGKSDGPVVACKECKTDTACNHGFSLNPGDFPTSAIFNGGDISNGTRLYAYGVYNGVVGPLRDAATAKQEFVELSSSCGSGWDGSSDTPPVGSGNITGGGATDPCNVSADFDFDQSIDLNDFGLFASYYSSCSQNTSASECSLGDLTCDQKTGIGDFVEFIKQYANYN
ncbi:hypothetical protein KC717_05070 [Candidatus Dojkabacteria bacterium]|uniref:Uncharacterized protein n=1 Tax=Candidatus Dojkabacteria bacterium TaxID=2099670 RepID=A0A955RKN8_9BACT|nr:hypothetical protein [Candidatus Dojkabacteria bacterium]